MPVKSSWLLSRAIDTALPQRRIYIRTDKKTRYLSVGSKPQLVSALAIAALLGWTGFTTHAYVSRALDGHSEQTRLETMREAYEARLAASDNRQRNIEEQLQQANLRRDAVTERLSDKQARLVETANRLQAAEAELDVLRGEFEGLVNARREDMARIAALDSELAGMRDSLVQARTSEANIEDALESFTGAMDRVIAERDRANSDLSRLDGEVTRLGGELIQWQDRQERLLAQLEEAARISFDGLATIFDRSNLDVDRIMSQARRDYTGEGGPFEPLPAGSDSDSSADTAAGDARVAALMKDLEAVNLMRFAAERLPFGEPVYGGRRTSGFGVRADPKGRGKAMHAGLDIAAPRGTAIYTTADGIVTFAGRQHGYGIMVKIRHAFGFETVYAHLSRARVKVGQRVSRGDRIADMGSTGRSTGTHLHYEVRIDDEPVNPVKFIEAARDVL